MKVSNVLVVLTIIAQVNGQHHEPVDGQHRELWWNRWNQRNQPTPPTQKPTQKPATPPTLRPTRPPTPSPTKVSVVSKLAECKKDIVKLINNDNTIGAKFIRMEFHDCVGGCDGCIDMGNPDNFGLDVPLNALANVCPNAFATHGITRSDMWVLAGLTAAEVLQPQSATIVQFPMLWFGRPTCEMLQSKVPCLNNICGAFNGPQRDLPSPNLDTRRILEYFATNFQFDAKETCALMGAHSLGKVARTNSGFVGTGWDSSPLVLNNAYYEGIVGPVNDRVNGAPSGWKSSQIGNSDLRNHGLNIPDRNQWSSGTTLMLNTDMGLVRDLSANMDPTTGKADCNFTPLNNGAPICPAALQTLDFMAAYRDDNSLWVQDFKAVFTKMMDLPFKTQGGSCGQEVCFIANLPVN